ncbi:MAG: hypothetical protein ACPG6L_10650 [Nereida ignava]
MSFNFNEISTGGGDYRQLHDTRLSAILDQLPDGTPESAVWQAFTAECAERITNYKSYAHLIRYWFSASRTMQELAVAEPEMFLDVVNHFQAKIEELT